MKRPATLTARFVETVSQPGRYGDGRGGHGLSLLVKPMASTNRISKSWSQRIRINGRETNIGIGSYPIVSLAEARAAALANRRNIAKGVDPRTGGIPTFAAAVDKVLDMHRETWRDSGKSEAQWRSSLAAYAFPTIGDKLVNEITTADVLAVLSPIWNAKRETARRVRQRVGAVMKWAIAEGHRAGQSSGRGDRLGAPEEWEPSQAPSGAPAPRRSGGARHGSAVAGMAGDKAGARIHGVNRGPLRRGPGRPMGGDGPRGGDMDRTGRAHEGRPRSPGPALGARGGDSERSSIALRRRRGVAGVPGATWRGRSPTRRSGSS